MKNKEKKKSFMAFFHELFRRIPAKRKKQFWLLFISMIFTSLVATVAVGAIALFAAAFSSPEKILDSKYIIFIQDILQMDFLNTPKGVMVFLSVLMVFLLGLKNVL